MKKVPTVYLRDEEDRRYVTQVVNPACDWVIAGEGVPRRKYDGTCVMYSTAEGRWYARREVKPGKNAPANFYLVQYDPITEKRVGWEKASQSPFAAFLDEAIAENFGAGTPWNGTYELIGPKINGNPEKLDRHMVIRHATADTPDELYDASIGNNTAPWPLVRFVGRKYGWEGIVWHHPDGRMAKLKFRDLPEPAWFVG